jgi:hypothetical protein
MARSRKAPRPEIVAIATIGMSDAFDLPVSATHVGF